METEMNALNVLLGGILSSGGGIPHCPQFEESLKMLELKDDKWDGNGCMGSLLNIKMKMSMSNSKVNGSMAKRAREFSNNANISAQFLKGVEKLDNYAIICLDGTSKKVLRSYINAVVKYRLWNMQRGICVDVSPVLQPYTMLYTTSPDSSFHFLIQYGNDTIDLVFDGKSAWFQGVVKDGCSFQFKDSIYLKHCTKLAFTGVYSEIAPGNDPGNIPMGLSNLIEAFKITNSYAGEASETFKKALGTWVLYFGEAPKFHPLFNACSRSIKDDNIKSLHSAGGNLDLLVRYWGKLCAIGMRYLLKSLHDSKIPALDEPLEEIQRIALPGINTLQDIIDNICIWTHSSPVWKTSSHIVALKSPSQAVFTPIDFTSDRYEDRVVKHFRQMMYAILSEKAEEKDKETKSEDMNDDVDEVQKHVGGHRAATIGHRAAVDFVERQRMLFSASSWNSDGPIKANHLGFCLSATNIKNPPKFLKDPVLTPVMKARKLFSTWSRFLRP